MRAKTIRWVPRAALLAIALVTLAPSGSERDGPATPSTLPEFDYGVPLRADEPPRIELVRVRKSDRRLELVSSGVVVKRYRIALGRSPRGHKQQEGDGKTPEGRYQIDWRKRDSDYHRALHVSYPSDEDRARAEARGVDPGGAIMIHGLPNGLGIIGSAHTLIDWTDGCIAVTNREIEEIWEWVADGVPIEIHP